MKLQFKVDVAAVLAAIRTAGALMLGNAFVAALVLGNRNYLALGVLAIIGCITIVSGALSRKE